MKTFEGSHIQQKPLEFDNPRVIFSMYLLRGLSVTLILLLFGYMAGELFSALDPALRFPGFVSSNILSFIALPLFLFLLQAIFYAYKIRMREYAKRSRGEMIMSYALPIIGIAAAVYTAYAIGAM